MKKFIILILFICIATSIGVSSVTLARNDATEKPIQSYRDASLERIMRLVKPTEIIMYVFEQCLIEQVDPVEVIAVLQVENSKHEPYAQNNNYKKVWDKKRKKNVFVIDSFDRGLFQLNSKCIEEFIMRFWTPYETAEFNIDNYRHNTRVAIRLYKSHLITYGNDQYAVCAYNGGSGNVNRNTVPKKTLEVYLPSYLKYKAIMLKE